mgnify:CR=1 FL=1
MWDRWYKSQYNRVWALHNLCVMWQSNFDMGSCARVCPWVCLSGDVLLTGTPSEAPSSYHNQMVNLHGHIPRRAVPSIAGNIQGYPHSNATSSLSGYQLPASVSNDQVNFIGRRNRDPIVKCYQIFSLYLIVPVFSPIIMMYVISDYLCINTVICMRIAVSKGMLFALTSSFISAWYNGNIENAKLRLNHFCQVMRYEIRGVYSGKSGCLVLPKI